MEPARYQWLSHFENAVPANGYGNKLSMYTLALEAWRRGIKVKFYTLKNPNNNFLVRFSLSLHEKEIYFESTLSNLISKEAVNICNDKQKTRNHLAEAGVPVPQGNFFTKNMQDNQIIKEVKSLGFPLVLKPVSANGGKGVFTSITSEEELKEIINHVREELGYSDIIIEKHINGEEFRILIADNQIIAAVNRRPANVVGDGISSINELINKLNKERKNNPYLANLILVIDKEVLRTLKSQNYTIEDVPEKEKQVFLRKISNASAGGNPVDFTDDLTGEMKEIALKAAIAIPGLGVCGIDLIKDYNTGSNCVIEVNTKPAMGLHLYPVRGKARDTVKAVIDYYFPETKNFEKSNLYFDFNVILDVLRANVTDEIKVLPPVQGHTFAKRYIISGKVQGVGYRKWIKKQSDNLKLNGYTKNLKNGKVTVIVAGQDKEVVDNFKETCLKGPAGSEVTNVEEAEWELPVKVAFEIIKDTEKRKIKKLSVERESLITQNSLLIERQEKRDNEIKQLTAENRKITRELEKLKTDYEVTGEEIEKIKLEKLMLKQKNLLMLNSRSWRYTKFFRDH